MANSVTNTQTLATLDWFDRETEVTQVTALFDTAATPLTLAAAVTGKRIVVVGLHVSDGGATVFSLDSGVEPIFRGELAAGQPINIPYQKDGYIMFGAVGQALTGEFSAIGTNARVLLHYVVI